MRLERFVLLAALIAGPVVSAPEPAQPAWLLVAVDSERRISVVALEKSTGRGRVTVQLRRTAREERPTPELVALDAGPYRLRYLEFEGGGRWRPKRGEPVTFEVVAGRINYPGDIGLEAGSDGLEFRTIDSSGRARTWLSDHHAETLRAAAVLYIGKDADGWTAQMEGR
jgi:hypothetical protein